MEKGDFDFSNDDLDKYIKTPEKIFGGLTSLTDPEIPEILNFAVRPAINKVLRNLPTNIQKNFPDNVKKLLSEAEMPILDDRLVTCPATALAESDMSSEESRKRYQKIKKRQETEFAVASSLDIESTIVFKDEKGKRILVLNDHSCDEVIRYKSFERYVRIISLCIGTRVSIAGIGEFAWEIKIWLPEMEIEDLTNSASKGLWTFKIDQENNLDFLTAAKTLEFLK